jgi:hypothetical protein
MVNVDRLGLIGDLPGIEKMALKQRLLKSEAAAAKHIISSKLGGSGSSLEDFYQELETDMDPVWLAIEPTYHANILKKHFLNPIGTAQQKSHRREVSNVLADFKRHKSEFLSALLARQEIMPHAVVTTLQHFGYVSDDFTAPLKPVRDSIQFWEQLGQALVHYHCWLHICGEWDTIFRECGMLPSR